MAKKNEEKFNYKAVVRKLKENGPQNLYLLWGPEDYLREYFLSEIKGLCLPDGDDSFSYKRMNGPDLDAVELQVLDADFAGFDYFPGGRDIIPGRCRVSRRMRMHE